MPWDPLWGCLPSFLFLELTQGSLTKWREGFRGSKIEISNFNMRALKQNFPRNNFLRFSLKINFWGKELERFFSKIFWFPAVLSWFIHSSESEIEVLILYSLVTQCFIAFQVSSVWESFIFEKEHVFRYTRNESLIRLKTNFKRKHIHSLTKTTKLLPKNFWREIPMRLRENIWRGFSMDLNELSHFFFAFLWVSNKIEHRH